MKTFSTPLFPYLEKHSESYKKKLDTHVAEEVSTESYSEITQLIKEDTLLTPSKTSINIIMDYARQKLD